MHDGLGSEWARYNGSTVAAGGGRAVNVCVRMTLLSSCVSEGVQTARVEGFTVLALVEYVHGFYQTHLVNTKCGCYVCSGYVCAVACESVCLRELTDVTGRAFETDHLEGHSTSNQELNA